MNQAFITRRGVSTSGMHTLIREDRAIVDYKRTLTKTSSTILGDFVLFAGGGSRGKKYWKNSQTEEKTIYIDSYSDNIFIFNSNDLSDTYSLKLDIARKGVSAVTLGEYAIFAGGSCGGALDSVDVVTTRNGEFIKYNNGLILSRAESSPVSAVLGRYAIVGGGWHKDISATVFDVFTINEAGELVLWDTFTFPQESRRYLSAAVIGNYVVFIGNRCLGDDVFRPVFDVFTIDSAGKLRQVSKGDNLTSYSSGYASAVVGDYLIFTGGSKIGNEIFDVYKLNNGVFEKVCDKVFRMEKISRRITASSLVLNEEVSTMNTVSSVSRRCAIFYGAGLSIFYMFVLKSDDSLKMVKFYSDIGSSQLSCSALNGKFICLEGSSEFAYRISAYTPSQ